MEENNIQHDVFSYICFIVNNYIENEGKKQFHIHDSDTYYMEYITGTKYTNVYLYFVYDAEGNASFILCNPKELYNVFKEVGYLDYFENDEDPEVVQEYIEDYISIHTLLKCKRRELYSCNDVIEFVKKKIFITIEGYDIKIKKFKTYPNDIDTDFNCGDLEYWLIDLV